MKYLKKIPKTDTYIDGHKVEYYYIDAKPEDIASLNRKQNNSINCGQKPVYQCGSNGEPICRYESVTQAGERMNVDPSSIRRCANEEYSTAGGYLWKWA